MAKEMSQSLLSAQDTNFSFKKKKQHPSLFPLGLLLLAIMSPGYVLNPERQKNIRFMFLIFKKNEKNTLYYPSKGEARQCWKAETQQSC